MGIKGFVLSAVAAAMMFSTGCAKQTRLFNGRDFTGWKMHVDDPSVDVNTVWTVKDGVIHCAGKPNGYIRTTSEYSDYKLHVEWRWPEEPTNSGVLLHASGKDQVWPRCIEAQLKHDSAGDFVLIRHTGITANGEHTQSDEKMFVSLPKKFESTEKEPGQWNSYDIYCKDDTIMLYVNGRLQNSGRKATETSGWICLQSEGSPIEFRNIYLERLK
ncbi:MAG TPA: DUF1080 domain-containing protein [Anaerohalosphaeraceae bacterium]|jgi:hypothetical protein|nr:DUF1080 domain-containing protein [Anaerohalosphaeraceae bacterium]HRT50551.1 DUF1080 domain-containing protein [Anaerohalosphaeraceae bacterium]HRT86509.1 DUF1080 domain-containing protein [Anaerohalosphaeraceae bacterium]